MDVSKKLPPSAIALFAASALFGVYMSRTRAGGLGSYSQGSVPPTPFLAPTSASAEWRSLSAQPSPSWPAA